MSGVLFEDRDSHLSSNMRRVNEIIETKNPELNSMPNLNGVSKPAWGLRNRKIDVFESETVKTSF